MKTLEAFCKAQGYQGGTIWQCLEAIGRYRESGETLNATVYAWGKRDGIAAREGGCIANYAVPHNSWDLSDNKHCTMSYLAGLNEGLLISHRLK